MIYSGLFHNPNGIFRSNKNPRFAFQWAFLFTDPATIAKLLHNIGELQGSISSLTGIHFPEFKFNCLVRDRTMFLADEAILISGMGNAEILIENSQTNGAFSFGLNLKRGNGLSGAHLTAEVAIIFAIAGSHDSHRGEGVQRPGKERGRLEAFAIALADSNARQATQAAIQEFLFRNRARGTKILSMVGGIFRIQSAYYPKRHSGHPNMNKFSP